jgi:hypothetical protein
MMTFKPVLEMTVSQLIAEYNARTGKHITGFSSRASAEASVTRQRKLKTEADDNTPVVKAEKTQRDALLQNIAEFDKEEQNLKLGEQS